MSAAPLRIAIIGCGRVAQHYIKILDSGVVDGYEIVGVCDAKPAVVEAFAKHFSCTAYTDFARMLDSAHPDMVWILTPSGLHFEHAKAALEKGVHVLTEKPITMTPTEAVVLDEIAAQMNLYYGVVFQNRLNPAIQALRAAINQGRFGKVVTATIRLRWCRYQEYYNDGWHGTWRMDGGVINQQAIHHVDALNWLMGPIEEVCASTARRANQLEAEDTLVAALKFRSGALGTIEATTAVRPQDVEASLSIVGEKGIAVIGGIALNKIEGWTFVEPRPEDSDIPQRHSMEVPNGYGLSHGPFLQQVIDGLRAGRRDMLVPAADGMKTTQLVHALYRSDETRTWISVTGDAISARLGLQKGQHRGGK